MTPITWYLYGRSGGAKKAAEEIGVKGSVSGDIAVISDGADDVAVKSLVAEITPTQDLHGYDSPWPAGGNVNTLDPDALKSAYGGAYGLNISRSGEWITISGTYTGEQADPQFRFIQKSDMSAFPDTYKGYPDSASSTYMPGRFGKADGDATLTIPLRNMVTNTAYNLKFRIMGYTGSTSPESYTPYSNICPISGRTGMTVTRAGKNLLDPNDVYKTSANIYFGRTTGVYLFAGITYTASYYGANNCTGIYANKKSDGSRVHVEYNTKKCTFTVPETGYYIINYFNNDGITYDVAHFQLETGTATTDYAPYAEQTYPISWQTEAGTVYGGTLDVVSGVLTVTHAVVDMGDLTWSYSPSLNGQPAFYNVINESKPPASNATKADITCSTYKTVSANELYADSTTTGNISLNESKTLQVRDFRYSTTADFKTAVTGQTLVYPLATPQTYQLTPTEVRTILGGNNIYTDAGAVSVEYVADTKLYIDNKVAELQALILEN